MEPPPPRQPSRWGGGGPAGKELIVSPGNFRGVVVRLRFVRLGRIAVRRRLRGGGGDYWALCSRFRVLFCFLSVPHSERGSRTKETLLLFTAGSTTEGQGRMAPARGRALCPALCWAGSDRTGPSPGGGSAAAAAHLLFAALCGTDPR